MSNDGVSEMEKNSKSEISTKKLNIVDDKILKNYEHVDSINNDTLNEKMSPDSKVMSTVTDSSLCVHPPDGQWGWVIVAASFIASVLTDGIVYCYGFFGLEYIKIFNITRKTVGMMGAIQVALVLGCGPMVTVMIEKLGYRFTGVIGGLIAAVSFGMPYFYHELWFIILFSCIATGIGFGIVYIPSVSIVNEWFYEKRPIALGIAVCGSGLGTFIFSPIIEMLLDKTDCFTTQLIIGFLLLLIIPCCLTYSLPPGMTQEITMDETKKKYCEVRENKRKWDLFTNWIFILICTQNLVNTLAFSTPLIFINDRSKMLGFTSKQSRFFISSVGIGNCIGRIMLGVLGGLRCCNRFILFISTCMLAGVILIVGNWSVNFYYTIFVMTMYGVFMGGMVTLTPLVLLDIFGLKLIATTFGMVSFCQAIGSFIGPISIGWIYDVTENYSIAFGVCGLIFILSGVMLLFCYLDPTFRKIKFYNA